MKSFNDYDDVKSHLQKGVINLFLFFSKIIGAALLALYFLSTIADWLFNLGFWDSIKLAIFDFL
jgi:hypothetical protein